MRIFVLEMKRTLLSRRNQVILLIGLLLSVVVPLISVHSERYRYTDSNGEKIMLTGLDAIAYRKNLYADYEGEVTADLLTRALSLYQEGVTEAGGLSVDDGAFPYQIYKEKIAPVRTLLDSIQDAYNVPSADGWYRGPSLEEMSVEEISDYYAQVKAYRSANAEYYYGENQAVADAVFKLSQKIDQPFLTYGVYSYAAMEYFELTILLLVILCGTVAAPAFSENYENGSDHIMRCTKYGTVHFGISKVCALSVILTVYYLLCAAIQGGILVAAFGTETLKTSVQIFGSVQSLASMNLGQLGLAIVFGGLLTVFSTMCLNLFLSAIMKTSFVAVLISTVMVIVPTILYFVVGISWIVFAFPASGVGLTNSLLYQLDDMNFVTVSNYAIWTPHMIYAVTVIEIVVFLLLAIRTYRKHQII